MAGRRILFPRRFLLAHDCLRRSSNRRKHASKLRDVRQRLLTQIRGHGSELADHLPRPLIVACTSSLERFRQLMYAQPKMISVHDASPLWLPVNEMKNETAASRVHIISAFP
jgi:hypothetical protein